VNPDAAQKILAVNRQFYQTFASQFSTTRMRLQPGVRSILERLSSSESILDLGCGNGYLACQVAEHLPDISYTGLDNSPDLLRLARGTCAGLPNITFHLADLSTDNWDKFLLASPGIDSTTQFTTILAFAVLHHLPGQALRANILKKVRALLKPGGQFIHSEWQFLKNPRLRGRIQPWETIGLSEPEVDPGDYLLDWRHGGQGLRYVHHYTESELEEIALATGFIILETFYADGEGGNLGLYQIWQPG
jgi:tRNA (uracil-5-)-methyltransferase TRM9